MATDNRTCECRNVQNQVCDECQGPKVHLHDYDPTCVESLVGECVLNRVEEKVANLSADRHPKWVRVEPGTVIPAGQPYRIEQDDPSHLAGEYVSTIDREAEGTESIFTKSGVWFVDSSWKPPLDLPTKPTWGIAIYWPDGVEPYASLPRKWGSAGDDRLEGVGFNGSVQRINASEVRDFIPLTDEQAARIEAAK